MQDVLLKFVTHLPKIDNAKALLVWLYKVAKNRCLMSRRKSKFAPRHELSLEELMPDRRELEVLGASESINPVRCQPAADRSRTRCCQSGARVVTNQPGPL
jgi:DNA-directed RNA polymerase specialized sigma24 family protein